jgi:chromosomal replication initiator protein
VTTSVRALEGALIRVVAYASMRSEEPTPALARHVLRRLRADEAPDSRSINEILEATAQEFGIEPQAIAGASKRREIVQARHVAIFLASELTNHSPAEIARAIGNRDRTSVNYALKQIDSTLAANTSVRNSVNNLRRRLAHPA